MEISRCYCGCNTTELFKVTDADIDQNGKVVIPAHVNGMVYGFDIFKDLERLKQVVFQTPTDWNHNNLQVTWDDFKNCPNFSVITFNETSYNVKNLLMLDKDKRDDTYYTEFRTYMLSGPVQKLERRLWGFTGTTFYVTLSQEKPGKHYLNTVYSEQLQYVAFSKNIAIESIESLEDARDKLLKAEKIYKDKVYVSLNRRIKKAESVENKSEQIKRKIRNLEKAKEEKFFLLCSEFEIMK